MAYASVVTAAARQGLGQHIQVVLANDPQHLIDIALLAQVSQVLAIMACTLGKTAFAVTLLRIVVQRRLIYVLWFIIVSMNLVNVLCAIFVFTQCEDPRHLWNQAIPSKCWPTYVFTNISLFVGGKCLCGSGQGLCTDLQQHIQALKISCWLCCPGL